ncbi:MAG: translation initiation factor IF-2 [Candidatus Binatia bacterium]
MGRTRIHELAKQWEVKSKDIIARLEKMGISGKKAQSVLDDAEAASVKKEMGLDGAFSEAAEEGGVEEEVTELHESDDAAMVTAIRTVTSKRVKKGVLLRRTRRTEMAEPGQGVWRPALPTGLHATTALSVAPDRLLYFDNSPFASAHSALALRFDDLATETSPAEETVAAVIPEPSAEAEAPSQPGGAVDDATPSADKRPDEIAGEQAEDERSSETPEPVAAVENGRPLAVGGDSIAEELLSAARASEEQPAAEEEKPTTKVGPRVLGRIDLSKRTAVAPTTPAAVEKPPAPDEQKAPGRKRKRKVVKKEDLFDAFERAYQVRPRKKRPVPGQKVMQTAVTTPKAIKRVVRIHEATSPGELAKAMGIKSGEVLGSLMKQGVMVNINDMLDFETVTLVADDFGYTVENTALNVDQLLEDPASQTDEGQELERRPPVVTVMGHVDHGKTSLLDVIRSSDVVSGESGGITQHIGAYLVGKGADRICFLDTPGHAAFTAMRARGASITDIVVLVTAADDGVMPQTVEAVSHATDAGIPIVVAINKVDKPEANPDRVKQQLAEQGIQPEDWGGDTQFVEVSAINKTGIDTLLEAINLQAEMLELKAPATGRAQGTVVEARLDKGRGPVATVLVQRGLLKRSDHFVCGDVAGRVRAISDFSGKKISTAGPSTPVEIIGLERVPEAGDSFVVVDDASRAERVAELRRDSAKKREAVSSTRMSLEDLQQQVAEGNVGELKVIIKADVRGSAEALATAIEKLGNEEVSLNVIHRAVGAITESDVRLAMASGAVVIGFHVRPEGKARALAESENVDIRLHEVIYEAIDEIRAALEGLLQPDLVEVPTGRAEVRDTFSIPGGTVIAGSYVTEGTISRGSDCRLLRDNVVIFTGKTSSLRRFKEDVREVSAGYECGIGIERYNDIKVGDVIEAFRIDQVKKKLEDRGTEAPPAERSP